MSAITISGPSSADTTYERSAAAHFVADVWVLTKRSLARIKNEPETLADVTIQPVIFVLLFAYVFGGAIGVPGGGSYHEYLIGGMLAMGLAQTAPGTSVAVVSDMSTGLIDRFRSLPMSRAAVLTARTLADLLTQVIGALVVAGSGLAIGWRVHTNPAEAIAAFALALLFGYSFTWAGVSLGMVLRSPEARAAARVPDLPALDVHLERVRADSGHARLAAGGRGMEPDERAGRRSPAPVRQPEPVQRHSRLADAAPGAGRHRLVGGSAADLRAAGRAPVPGQDARLTGYRGMGWARLSRDPGRAPAEAYVIHRIHDLPIDRI